MLKEMANKVRLNGPDRVMVNHYEARPTKLAREQFGITPDVIFVRHDGWSLGASREFESAAFSMWQDKWVGFMRRPSFDIRGIGEY